MPEEVAPSSAAPAGVARVGCAVDWCKLSSVGAAAERHPLCAMANDETRQLVLDYLRQMRESSAADARLITGSFHKTLTTLSAGGIAISIGLADRLGPEGRVTSHHELIVGSWGLLLIALICVLVSFLFTTKNYEEMGRIVGRLTSSAMFDPEFNLQTIAKETKEFQGFSAAPQRLSVVAVCCFAAGVGCLVAYAAINAGA